MVINMNTNDNLKKILGAAAAFSLFLTGCNSSDKEKSSENSETEISNSISESSGNPGHTQMSQDISLPEFEDIEIISSIDNLFSDRDLEPSYTDATASISLDGDSVSIDGTGVSAEGSVITITDEGIYHISGKLNDGQIIIDSQGKVQLVLDNADISCSYSSPVYTVNSDKTFITLAENSENTLTDGTAYVYSDETANEPDAVIFSHDSLTVNGSGVLNINANYNEGITSKDDIVITGGTININSVGNSIKGKNYVAVCNAEINIDSAADGIKSTNIEESSLGFVYVQSGTFNIVSAEDGIQTDTEFIAEGGTFNITSGGGSSEAEPQMGNDFGRFDRNQFENTESTEDTTISTKGIKGSIAIHISGGSFNINSADDALHSNANICLSGGELTLDSGDDGVHSDARVDFSGSSVNIINSYEGIESSVINVTDGNIELKASDDAFNASDGTTVQGGMGTYSDGVLLSISGGNVYVDSAGDGLDSNGNMFISGGSVIVNGPTNNGNGALDGNNQIVCTGGTLIAAGSSGMAEHPGNASTQNTVSITLDQTQQANTLITLCDESGTEILSFAPAKTFDNIIISSPEIKTGKTYYAYAGGTSSAEQEHGLYLVGGYNGDGTEAGSFTVESVISFIGSQGNMMGGNFGGGGFGGGRDFGGGKGNRGDFEMPTDENGEFTMPDGGFGGHGNMQPPQGGGFGMGEMIEPPTGENGMPEMPQGGFDPGMLPYEETTE